MPGISQISSNASAPTAKSAVIVERLKSILDRKMLKID